MTDPFSARKRKNLMPGTQEQLRGENVGRHRVWGTRAAITALLCAAVLAATAPAAAQPASIRHSPVPSIEAGRSLTVDAVLTGDLSPELIATADVVVVAPDGGLISIPLAIYQNSISGEIPGALVAPPELAYRLRVIYVDGGTVSAPPGAPSGGFFTTAVTATADQAEAGGRPDWASASVEILTPAPGEVVLERTPQIAAVMIPPLEEPWDALVVLDGEDVSEAAAVTSELLVFVPLEPLTDGAHRITFSAATLTGVVESSWVFHVMERTGDAADGADWPAAATGETAAWSSSDSPAADWPPGRPGAGWQVSGRLEAGWAVVAAEATAVESTDVVLPYPELNRPAVDFYLSGVRGDGTLLITARQDPVYSDDLEWLVSAENRRFGVDAGQIFPSLSHSTLNWAVGKGISGAVRVGRSTTELLGMRLSEADTLAGFGIYSRFAVGAKESFDWNDRLSTSVVYLSVFDREDSVPDEQRLSEPLRNSVVAGIVRTSRGWLAAEVEAARSVVEGEEEGRGAALRAKLSLERDWRNRVSLEYASSEPDFYSAGSYEYDPGEHSLELSYSVSPGGTFRSSGWVRTVRTFDSGASLSTDELEFKAYSRAEATWPSGGDAVRAYVIVRYDRVPYDTHDYRYVYGALGGSWRRGVTRLAASVSRSATHSPDEARAWSAYADLRHELLEDRWTARVATRWTTGTGDETDYTRMHHTLETRWDFGRVDVTTEYWLIDREDGLDPTGSYTEHVFRVGVGRDL